MYLGIDIGSVSIKYVVINDKVTESGYFRIKGNVLKATKEILDSIKAKEITAIGTTGSARQLVAALVSADLVVDEITAHRTAVARLYPHIKTIFEIGGQDSKLISIGEHMINFEMNNACAAGTGSFLDQQANRLGLTIEEFCKIGMMTDESFKIASKCTVFAETDMIHAQQSGIPIEKIIRGVHRGLINNYFMQLCRGKKLMLGFLFEGGTSDNALLVEELAMKLINEKLIERKEDLIVPENNKLLGAIGAAMLCSKISNKRKLPKIKDYAFVRTEKCEECQQKCGADITVLKVNNKIIQMGKSCQ